MVKQATDFFTIFEILAKHNVEYIIIGGVSAVLQGAPVTTFDLDVVHNRDEDNLNRLLEALQELNAYYRTKRDKRIEPNLSRLALPGHHLLLTDAGPLDILGTVGEGQDYQDLLDDIAQIEIEEMTLQLQGLQSVIELKEYLGRDKDKAVIPILKRTLEEKNKMDDESE